MLSRLVQITSIIDSDELFCRVLLHMVCCAFLLLYFLFHLLFLWLIDDRRKSNLVHLLRPRKLDCPMTALNHRSPTSRFILLITLAGSEILLHCRVWDARGVAAPELKETQSC